MESISKSLNTFAVNVYKELSSSNNDKDIFCSPISLASTLSLLTMGAKGETSIQLKKVLGFNQLAGAEAKPATRLRTAKPKAATQMTQQIQKPVAPFCDQVEDVHLKFQSLLQKLKSLEKDTQLNIANGVYTQKKFAISQQYLQCAKMLYHAQLESVDFTKDDTRQEINEWVENETQGKIKDLFSPDSIDRNTAMILVNAIYFKGQWKNKFNVEDTKEAPFYVSKDEVKSVQMMHQTQKFNVAIIEELGAKILELPYGTGELCMYILLTDEKYGLKKIEQRITAESLAKWTTGDNMINTRVDVSLPRFNMEESYDFGQHLINMGIVDAFSQQKANLLGISEKSLYVSKVFHKAIVEVNEDGTEAAAGTGVVIIPKMLPLSFKADHPFQFYITHTETNCILFSGKCISP